MYGDGESDSGDYLCITIWTVGVFVSVVPDVADIDMSESDLFAYVIGFGQYL